MNARERDLREHLRIVAGMVAPHRSLESAVLEHGVAREWSPLPPEFRYARAKECFTNAFNLVAYQREEHQREDLRYAEGYALGRLGIPIHHAWAVDGDGHVIDVTWRHADSVECGHCLGSGEIEVEAAWDEEDGEAYEWEARPCALCDGTGEGEYDSLEGSVYLGVEFDRETMVAGVLAKKVYGLLDSPDLDKLLESRLTKRGGYEK